MSRRIYLAQYAAELVMKEDGVTPWAIDEPFLKNGRPV